jgi:type II secretory pathway pseudopilin PulG
VNGASGLTLVEVLLALVVMSVAFVALANAQIGNLKVTRDAQLATMALELANEQLEKASGDVTADFAHYQTCPSGSGCSWSGTAEGGFSYAVTLTGLPSQGLVLVDVIVSGPMDYRLATYVSCYDGYPSPSARAPAHCP